MLDSLQGALFTDEDFEFAEENGYFMVDRDDRFDYC